METLITERSQDIAERAYLGKEVSEEDYAYLADEVVRTANYMAALTVGEQLWLAYTVKYVDHLIEYDENKDYYTLKEEKHNA